MTNDELEQLLKISNVPERENQFWENLSKNVTRQIRSQARPRSPIQQNEYRGPKFKFAVWGIGIAAACLVMGFLFGFHSGKSHGDDEQIVVAKKYFREIETLFPNQLRAIAFDSNGPKLLLSDKPDVPASAPLFLEICDGKKCERFVTFSGQQIEVDGEPMEVLSGHAGKILLIGRNTVWSSDGEITPNGRVIQAQFL